MQNQRIQPASTPRFLETDPERNAHNYRLVMRGVSTRFILTSPGLGETLPAMTRWMTYKYRLRPTAEQRVLLGKIAGTVTVKF